MAQPLLVRYSSYIYAVLRVIVGLSFALHGTQKVFGIPGNKAPMPIASLLGVGGLIELICGLLIALGLWASYAAFLASGEMAAAYFMVHASKGLLPIVNGGELSVLYCFLFLYIAAHGSGIWSVDAWISKTGSKRSPAVELENP
ncbi:DoxX family protein [Leptolyngbya sp. NIES-3755]|nr:DoxX family protein [Leptolyngbya sp. NIES-3755]